MTLDEFVRAHTGTFLDFDQAYGAQCVDLVEFYCREVLGDHASPPFRGNAIDFFGERTPGYKWVRNDPHNLNQLPPRGAIMVWGPSSVGTGPLGHVDVVLDRNPSYFDGFDQNWPVGAACHAVRHSYTGIIGWGYPAAWDAAPAPAPVPAPTPAPTPKPIPIGISVRAWQFDTGDDLHPADGVMALETAEAAALAWLQANPGRTIRIYEAVTSR